MEDFLKHIEDPNPNFSYYKAGADDESAGFVLDVRNRISSGASEDELNDLSEILNENTNEIKTFYKLHNGIQLYCQDDNPAIEFFEISQWLDKNEEWKEWFEDLEDDEIWDFQKEGIAFGEISFSGNYFVFNNGKIYYSDHDGGDDEPLANSFYEFLTLIVTDPAKFLYDLGCYTRYDDGKTDIQWIPKSYSGQ